MKRSFGRRINQWLAEPSGEIFRDGKWRFWFPTLIGLTALNVVMTAVIFGQDGMQKYIGSIVVLAGAVLCWLALGLLHYSDAEDRLLAAVDRPDYRKRLKAELLRRGFPLE